MIREHADAVSIDVLVQPRASKAKLGPIHGDRLKIAVTAPPVEGEANAAVTELFADALSIPTSAIAITAGASSRRKTVRLGVPRARLDALLAALLLALCACDGNVNTIDVTLATAPNSTVLDAVQTLKLTLTNPPQTQTATRSSDGKFAIDLQLDATSETGALVVDGMDASGTIVATGASPPFPLGGVTASVVVYMAPPLSISEALVPLAPARDSFGIAPVPYGAVMLGGKTADGAPASTIAIYNAFSHAFQIGVQLPVAKASPAVAVGTSGYVYVLGGTDATGSPNASVERFDSSVSPSGAITSLGTFDGFARTGQTALSIGSEKIMLTGSPIGVLDGVAGTLTARTDLASLPATGAAVTGNDGVATAIFVGASGVIRFRNNAFDTLGITGRDNAQVLALPGGKVGVACGAGNFLRIDAVTGTFDSVIIPSTPRSDCAVAATTRYLLIAGGTSDTGDLETTAELYNAATLALVATLPLVVPRAGASAIALPNDQILIAGGHDANGQPIGTMELFTPDSTQ
ncbi:MAG TPA: DUF167 family protein [Kofleriaceae bacterium]